MIFWLMIEWEEDSMEKIERIEKRLEKSLADKIKKAVEKRYEVQDKAEDMLEKEGLKKIVERLKTVDARLEVAERMAEERKKKKKVEIESAYDDVLKKFYERGGMKGNVSEGMLLSEKRQAIEGIEDLEDVKVLVEEVHKLKVEKKACKEALEMYFERNKEVIIEEMEKKQDEDKRVLIRESGILEML